MANHMLSAIIDIILWYNNGPKQPPVFILGPPRSGSTLVMQVLTDAFRLGYLSNRHCAWFAAPALAQKVFRPLEHKKPSDYSSRHGRTNGIDAPAECGAWWYRFFRRNPPYVRLEEVSDGKMRAFRHSLASLETTIGLPLIFKNLYVTLRLEPIAHYLPNALFVVIERDLVNNAQSILKGRYDALGDYDRWWSVPPPNIDELKELSPVQQVVEQVRSIHALIDSDIARFNLEERTFRIKYEDFCQDIPKILERFEAFMCFHGINLARRFDVPGHFQVNKDRKIPEVMYKELMEYVDQLERDCIERHSEAMK